MIWTALWLLAAALERTLKQLIGGKDGQEEKLWVYCSTLFLSLIFICLFIKNLVFQGAFIQTQTLRTKMWVRHGGLRFPEMFRVIVPFSLVPRVSVFVGWEGEVGAFQWVGGIPWGYSIQVGAGLYHSGCQILKSVGKLRDKSQVMHDARNVCAFTTWHFYGY